MFPGVKEVIVKPFPYIVCGTFFLSLLIGGTASADTDALPEEAVVTRQASVTAGYQSFSLRNEPSRAAEYRNFSSSPTFGLSFYNDSEGNHFRVDANYLSDEDFHTEASLSKGSQMRLDLRSERFYHNLDHIPYDNGYIGDGNNRTADHAPAAGSRPDGDFNGDIRTYYTDHEPGEDYGLRIDINEVKVRAKLPDYPAHLNLAYWRMEKKGERQLRFADENCTGCHMQSRTRDMDRVTDEIKAGLDAHIGYVDVATEFIHREFRNKDNSIEDSFGSHFLGRAAGDYDHSVDPDSEMNELTLRANTSPAGGLIGSASFTIGERENNTDLTSVGPVKAETDYYKTAADVTYTPGEAWTISMRYRLIDLDSDNSDYLTVYAGSDPNLEVRDAIDYERSWYEAIVNYRPANSLTLKAELRREDIDRSNTGPPEPHHSTFVPGGTTQIDPYWELPSTETITRAKIGFRSRLLEKSALKLSGWAMLKHSDDPAYGTSFSDSGELFFSANYNPTPFWGLSASIDFLNEDNDDRTVYQFDANDAPVPYDLDRERQQQTLSVGSWYIPVEGLTFDLNYGYLATQVSQDLLFGAEPSQVVNRDYTIKDDDVDYDQTVHTLSAGATWQVRDSLNCRVEGYHIRSEANFDPDFMLASGFTFANGASATSGDLKQISKLDIRQNGLQGRLNWQIDNNWSCSVTATYDDYDDKNSNVFDGSVMSYMASVSRTW